MRTPSLDLKEKKCKDSVCQATNPNNCKSTKNVAQLIGKHENQISFSGEAGLHTHFSNCTKNPGHRKFIPIESFSLKHLPEGHQDSNLHEFIKDIADLTVRVNVTMTSPDRPEFWPNTKTKYFLSELRGKETFRTGTGKVTEVKKCTVEDKRWYCLTCPCDTCKASDKPSNVWWKIRVDTAAHVVIDDLEASHTTLRLFYDSEVDDNLVILKDKVRVKNVNIEDDRCQLTCVTCDENLGNKLEKMVEKFNDARRKVSDKYNASRDFDKLNFIVSHPHGCSKQVSIGQWKEKSKMGRMEYNNKFTYTTCTCTGSSGATVYCVGYNDGFGLSLNLLHSGTLKPELNYSGFGIAM